MLIPDCIKMELGHVVKTHGVKGELSVALSDFGLDRELESGDPLIVEIEGLDVPFFVKSVRPRGEESLLLTFDSVETDTEASKFVGMPLYVYVAADSLEADDGELTADDLIGYTVTDSGKLVGKIADIREIGPDCWYFVMADSGALIPIADEMIVDIDHDNMTVDMNLPEGLLDL